MCPGTIPGYHCWAQFYLERYGCIPADASERGSIRRRRITFSGRMNDNRLQFSGGRDIRLDPPQQGEPLNYFIYPNAELDGKPVGLKSEFSFQDRMSSSD